MENAHDKLEGKRLTQNVYMCLLTENKDGFESLGEKTDDDYELGYECGFDQFT